jgi:signal peptidase I
LSTDKKSSKSEKYSSTKGKGKGSKDEEKKSKPKEYFDALIYAAVVAFLIKIFLFEAYRIPTGSMEETLLVGDFLLVTKFTYGPTTPRNVPFTDIRLPYVKLPGFKDPKRGDIIVFDWPGEQNEIMPDVVTNYIKRCVGLPGDTIRIIDKKLFVNGQPFPDPPNVRYSAAITNMNNTRIYPRGMNWTEDNYGPVVIPKEGDVVKIDSTNYMQWAGFMRKEGHKVEFRENRNLIIDDVQAPNNEYRVERDYLFMMGDNRNNSLDSRFWGFMPTENIVGEAFMIYWSWNPDISIFDFFRLMGTVRWNRIGTFIK